ncbi:MAG: hypothetical protein H0Z28_11205 [Archaeoglobus sp.]|nr:hypothetical protein [Archaeoglobus sp.]
MPDATKVHVYSDGNLKGSFNVDGSGNWSGSISDTAGAHDITAKAEDAAGNISSQTLKKVYLGSSSTPYIDLLTDTGESSTDNITNDNTPKLRIILDLDAESNAMGGKTIPLESVAAFELQKSTDGGNTWETVITITQIDQNPPANFWADYTISTALPDGEVKFRARWKDAKGNWSNYGSILTITIDTQAPNAPSISIPADGQVFVGTTLQISGTAS